MKLKSIAVVTCWYGEYPWYFPYFIHSCAYNPTIDFIIITDNESEIPNKPDNVKIIFKQLEEIKKEFSVKLGFEVNIDFPYKLCDFKPAYGYVFDKILDDYDFWGHGDIDLVYGDIREFMTYELLNDFDVLSSRHDYITGSFALLKNNKRINSLFLESRDYKQVFSSVGNYCFDECNYLFKKLEKGASIFDFPDNIESMTLVVKRAENEGRIKVFFDFIIVEGNPGNIKWDNGKVIYKDRFETMFYHLIKFKEKCKKRTILNPIPNTYYFTSKNIKSSI
jgi:hypothetical protein